MPNNKKNLKLDIIHESIEKLEIKNESGKSIAKIDSEFLNLADGYTAHIKPKSN